MIRIDIRNGGTFLTEGPIEIVFDAGWPGTDVTGGDPPEFSIKAPPHNIQIWSRETQVILTEEPKR